MLLWKCDMYMNKRESGGHDAGLYHETEEGARLAAKGHEDEYASIAVHSERREYRCDACKDEGKVSAAWPHASGRDLCPDHSKALDFAK